MRVSILTKSELVEWASDQILSIDRQDRLILYSDILFALPEGHVGEINTLTDRLAGVTTNEDFLRQPRPKQFLKTSWIDFLRSYLNGERSPYDVMIVTQTIETYCDFPAWLGNMYNVTDWVEQEATRSQHPSIEKEAQRIIDDHTD